MKGFRRYLYNLPKFTLLINCKPLLSQVCLSLNQNSQPLHQNVSTDDFSRLLILKICVYSISENAKLSAECTYCYAFLKLLSSMACRIQDNLRKCICRIKRLLARETSIGKWPKWLHKGTHCSLDNRIPSPKTTESFYLWGEFLFSFFFFSPWSVAIMFHA